jgi:hypothetical protein
MFRSEGSPMPQGLLPEPPRGFRSTIITNATPETTRMSERVVEAGTATERTRTLDLSYPPGVFSLSHIALPFPVSDSLYGLQPEPVNEFGIGLGAIAPRGERGALIVSMDALTRISSNPFFPYMLERIEETIGRGTVPAPGNPSVVGSR